MRSWRLTGLLIFLSACSSEKTHRDGDWRKTFEGNVLSVNDQPITSSFRMTFYSTDGDETPDRYHIASECFDAGYFDKDRQVFLSSTSPKGYGADKMSEKGRRDMAEGGRRRCPSNDPAVYNQLIDVMYEGAVLTVDGEQGRLVAQSGASITLAKVPMALLLD
jgi:hypothetical protein